MNEIKCLLRVQGSDLFKVHLKGYNALRMAFLYCPDVAIIDYLVDRVDWTDLGVKDKKNLFYLAFSKYNQNAIDFLGIK